MGFQIFSYFFTRFITIWDSLLLFRSLIFPCSLFDRREAMTKLLLSLFLSFSLSYTLSLLLSFYPSSLFPLTLINCKTPSPFLFKLTQQIARALKKHLKKNVLNFSWTFTLNKWRALFKIEKNQNSNFFKT